LRHVAVGDRGGAPAKPAGLAVRYLIGVDLIDEILNEQD
jgi:hypothetical protein